MIHGFVVGADAQRVSPLPTAVATDRLTLALVSPTPVAHHQGIPSNSCAKLPLTAEYRAPPVTLLV